MAGSAAERAAEALDLVRADPGGAESLAAGALDEAVAGHDAAAEAVARRVLGMVARERQSFEEARDHFEAAVAAAERSGSRQLAAVCRMSLAGALLFLGRGADALALVDAVIPELSGVERARARFQRAVVL